MPMFNSKIFKIMKKVYVLLAIVLMSFTGVSCTAENVTEEIPTQNATTDTGGQDGSLTPPPPPPTRP